VTAFKIKTTSSVTEIPKDTSFTLAPDDTGRRFVAIAAITITLPTPGVLGNGFDCRIVNDSGGSVILDGRGLTNVTMSDGDVARIIEANSKQRVVDETSTVVGDLFSPDNPLWDPSVFGLDFDLVHWWDASSGVTIDPASGLVSGWADKIRSLTPTQTVTTQQPAWPGSNEIRFNGHGLGLTLDSQGRAAYESKWWLMLFRVNWTAMAASTDAAFFAINGLSNQNGQKQPQFRYLHATHQITTDWYSNSGLVSLTMDIPGADDTWHSLICRRTDSHIYASVDGAAESSLSCYPRAFLDTGSVPVGYFGNQTGGSGNVTSIGIDTLLWGQRDISSDEIAAAHAWALWKRGAQASLDAGSPYLLAAPTMTSGDVHVCAPDAYADGYRFPTSGGWDDTLRGNALDLTGFTQTFHDHFTSISTVTDGLTGAGQWYAPAHIDTSNAKFKRPSQTPTDTYTILPDNTTLQIKMQKLSTGGYASGHIQSADSWRNGFTQSVPPGGSTYYEARMAFNAVGIDAFGATVNPAPSWPAFWLYTILDNRDSAATKCEIDIVEAYGDSAGSGKQIHLAAHDHGAYRPQPGNFGTTGGSSPSHTPSKVVDTTQSPFNVTTTLFDGTGEGLPGTFHTYGVMIDETWMTWYFDGKIVSRFATFKEALGELYIIVNLQSQDLTSPANCQTYLWVDYVDAYSHA
jgi:hypothetical protein